MHRLHGIARRAAAVLAVTVTALALASCGAGAGDGGKPAVTGHRADTVASGTTLNQRLPDRAASTELVDQDGNRTSLGALRGQVVVLAPLLTLCQETCPMTSVNLHRAAEAAQRSGTGARVRFVELTVDPARDTVRRMHAYEKLYGALPDWSLLTGRPDRVKAVWKALGVSTDKVPTHEPVRDWMTGRPLQDPYDVHHQDVVFVIDPAGHLRWLTIGRPDAHGAPLPTSLKKFLNDEGRDNYRNPGAGGADSWDARDIERAVHYVEQVSNSG